MGNRNRSVDQTWKYSSKIPSEHTYALSPWKYSSKIPSEHTYALSPRPRRGHPSSLIQDTNQTTNSRNGKTNVNQNKNKTTCGIIGFTIQFERGGSRPIPNGLIYFYFNFILIFAASRSIFSLTMRKSFFRALVRPWVACSPTFWGLFQSL